MQVLDGDGTTPFDPGRLERRLERAGLDAVKARAITGRIANWVASLEPKGKVTVRELSDALIRAASLPFETDPSLPAGKSTVTLAPTLDGALMFPPVARPHWRCGWTTPPGPSLPPQLPPPVLRTTAGLASTIIITAGEIEIPAGVLWHQFWKIVAEWLAKRGIVIAGLAVADGPLPIGDLIALGLTIWLIWELIEHWDELWAAAEAAALAATQMMASSLDWIAKKLGVPRYVLRDRIHKIKQREGLRGDENVRIDPETGGVYGPNGENIGNVQQPQ